MTLRQIAKKEHLGYGTVRKYLKFAWLKSTSSIDLSLTDFQKISAGKTIGRKSKDCRPRGWGSLAANPPQSALYIDRANLLTPALWHPDKLQNMAPELQVMATEQVAK
jgi:hypothetical protein